MNKPKDGQKVKGLTFDPIDQKSLWNHMIKKSCVRLGTKTDFDSRDETIRGISDRVQNGAFSPNTLGFLCSSKANGIPRFIPVLDIETTSVFFACIKAIDETCADQAVPGTFGGWSLGGKRRKVEEIEVVTSLQDAQVTTKEALIKANWPPNSVTEDETADAGPRELEEEALDDASVPSSPYNTAAWVENWQEFWKITAITESKANENDYFVSFDVANFYDSIDLVRLRRRLQDKCPDQMHALDVLEFLLTQWNKSIRFYQPSSKGIPMDMVGDMSRVLANFYLVEFDAEFRALINSEGGSYVRYADDMIFTCANQNQATEILYKAGFKLHEMSLNINTSKVKIRNKQEFRTAWGFEIMDSFQDCGKVDQGLKLLEYQWDEPGFERRETALKRAITIVGQRNDAKEKGKWIFDQATKVKGFCTNLRNGQMQSLIKCAEKEEDFVNALIGEVMATPFTEPKTHLLRCLENRNTKKGDFTQASFDAVRNTLLASEHPILRLAAKNSPYLAD